MKYTQKLVVLTPLLSMLALSPAMAGAGVLAAGIRTHTEHSEFEELPFTDGDLSYGLAYEYHDPNAYWQCAVMYAEKAGAEGEEVAVLTPQVSLIFTDEIWRLGAGALMSQIDPEDGKKDWTDLYWQITGGIGFPVHGLSVDIFAHYAFEKWTKLTDFDTDDIEFGAWLGMQF